MKQLGLSLVLSPVTPRSPAFPSPLTPVPNVAVPSVAVPSDPVPSDVAPLKTYLRLDVDILYKAAQGWRRTIVEEIGVDFVQTGKFTVSTVSNHARDLCSSKNLQIGQFFPNSGPIYRLLRKGMRG